MLDENNQTHSVVSPEHTVMADIEKMPDLILDVSKEYQTTMHAKVPSQQDHLVAKMQGLSELCSFKRDENNVQEYLHYGFMTLNIKITEDCTSNEKE